MKDLKNTLLEYLVPYYGILQICHLGALTRASMIFMVKEKMVFPASPPAGGWTGQVIPFLLGMGAVDAVAAGLGVFYAWNKMRKQKGVDRLGVISLTAAITSALVFGAGTIASGAWTDHTLEYVIMLILFTPLLPLYISLLRS